jgi:hypothetical protein
MHQIAPSLATRSVCDMLRIKGRSRMNAHSPADLGLAVADGQFPTLRPEYRPRVRKIEPNRPSTSRTSRPRDRPKPRSLSGLRLTVVSCPSATARPRRRATAWHPGVDPTVMSPAAIWGCYFSLAEVHPSGFPGYRTVHWSALGPGCPHLRGVRRKSAGRGPDFSPRNSPD